MVSTGHVPFNVSLQALRIGFPSKVTAELRQHTLLAQAEEHPLKLSET